MLNRKIAIITGGTGGIGESLCNIFSNYGAKVIFTYNSNEEKAKEMMKNGNLVGYKVNAIDFNEVENFSTSIIKEYKKVDILVNNVGITQIMPFALIDESDWDNVMNTNVKSMFLMTKSCVRQMIKQKSGSVVNLSSLAGHRLLEVPVHYATSKSAVLGFTISLAKELCRYNIRVNSISPGLINTGVGLHLTESQLAEYHKYCATGRAGEPHEVAELIAFLASDKASYINAQNIFLDGGI